MDGGKRRALPAFVLDCGGGKDDDPGHLWQFAVQCGSKWVYIGCHPERSRRTAMLRRCGCPTQASFVWVGIFLVRPHIRFNQELGIVVVGEELQSMHRLWDSTVATELPHCGNRLVDKRRANGAALDREHIVRVVPVIPQRELRRVPHLHASSVAVIPWRRRM